MNKATRLRSGLIIAACVLAATTGCAKKSDEFRNLYMAGLKDLAAHQYQSAESSFKAAAALAEKRLAEPVLASSTSQANKDAHLQLADALTAVARVYSDQGKYASAKDPLTRAEKEYETAFGGPNHVRVAGALNELAACYHREAQYEEAELYALKALAIREKLLAPNDLFIASTCNNLAEICSRIEENDRAEEYFNRAIKIYSASDKPEAAKGRTQTLNNLALFYSRNMRLEEARAVVTEALNVETTHAELKTSERAATLLARASIERAAFEIAKAEADFKEAIQLLSSDKTDRSAQLCEATDNYADMLSGQHRFEEAEPVYKTAIGHCNKAHGPDHPCVAERINDLAELYHEDGRLEEAEKLLTQALAINRQSFDSDSPVVVKTINELSAVYLDQKKYKQAEAVYQDWVPELERVLGSKHPHVMDALDNWAMIASKANDKAGAAKLTARAKALREALRTKQPLQPVSSTSTKMH